MHVLLYINLNFNHKYSTYILNHTGRLVCSLLPFSCTLVPVGSCQGILLCLYDVVMWFPPILSRVEYPSRPSCAQSWIIQQPGPFSVRQTARSTPCTPAASYAWRFQQQALHIAAVWPARAALAIPFLLSAAQGLKPDSPESLAGACGRRGWRRASPLLESIQ